MSEAHVRAFTIGLVLILHDKIITFLHFKHKLRIFIIVFIRAHICVCVLRNTSLRSNFYKLQNVFAFAIIRLLQLKPVIFVSHVLLQTFSAHQGYSVAGVEG